MWKFKMKMLMKSYAKKNFWKINWNWRFGQLPWNARDNYTHWNKLGWWNELHHTILETYFDLCFKCTSDKILLESNLFWKNFQKLEGHMQKIDMFIIDDHYHQEKNSKN